MNPNASQCQNMGAREYVSDTWLDGTQITRGAGDLLRSGRNVSVMHTTLMTLTASVSCRVSRIGGVSMYSLASFTSMSRQLYVDSIIAAAASTDWSDVTSIVKVATAPLMSETDSRARGLVAAAENHVVLVRVG
jgi:hypothetical protein